MVDRHAVYLEWCKGGHRDEDEDEDIPEGDIDEGGDRVDGGDTAELEDRDTRVVGRSDSAVSTPSLYHPPHLRSITASTIIADQQATRFLESLQAYLVRTHTVSFAPRHCYDKFNLLGRVTCRLPAIPETSATKGLNQIHASPPRPRRARAPAEAAYHDFALVRTDRGERNAHTIGTPLEGKHVVLLRCH